MNEIQKNGVMIVRTPTGLGVATSDMPPVPARMLLIEVEYMGQPYKADFINSYDRWRDYYHGIDMLKCAIRVKQGEKTLAELGVEGAPMPFMVRQGPQVHITEAYVSCPPALTITDEAGRVFTLGFGTASKWQSPEGEFAFPVLCDGVDTGEIASRIERRNKVKIFTYEGWKTWNGRSFF